MVYASGINFVSDFHSFTGMGMDWGGMFNGSVVLQVQKGSSVTSLGSLRSLYRFVCKVRMITIGDYEPVRCVIR